MAIWGVIWSCYHQFGHHLHSNHLPIFFLNFSLSFTPIDLWPWHIIIIIFILLVASQGNLKPSHSRFVCLIQMSAQRLWTHAYVIGHYYLCVWSAAFPFLGECKESMAQGLLDHQLQCVIGSFTRLFVCCLELSWALRVWHFLFLILIHIFMIALLLFLSLHTRWRFMSSFITALFVSSFTLICVCVWWQQQQMRCI